MRATFRSAAIRYVVAVVAAGLAILVRALLDPVFGLKFPLLTSYPAIAVTAWFGGFGPGLVTTVLCAAASAFLWLPPVSSFSVPNWGNIIALGLFLGIGLLISGLTDGLRRARGRDAANLAPIEAAISQVEVAGQKLYTVILRDISERRRAEEARQASEARYRSLFEANIVGIAVADGRGRIWDGNDEFLGLAGFTREEVQGGRARWDERTPPEYMAVSRQMAERLKASGVCPPFEKEFVRPDGRRVPVLMAGAALEGSDQHIAFPLDISDRKRAEQERAELLRQAQAARAEAEAVARMMGHIQAVAEAGLTHLTIDDLLRELLSRVQTALASDTATILLLAEDGEHLIPFSSEGLREELGKDIRIPMGRGVAGRIAMSERGMAFDDLSAVEVISSSLRQKVKSVIGVPLKVEGRTIGVILVGTVTPRHFTDGELALLRLLADRAALAIDRARLHESERAARAEAEVANRVKDEFLAILSHELRGPLNTILMWTQVLRTQPMHAATVAPALDAIERQTKAQAQLIADLLDVSRIVAGKLLLEFRPVELAPVVEAALDGIRATAIAKGLKLEVALQPGIRVSGDMARLQQVVWNLLANAVKFTPARGRIEVRLEAIEEAARIVVHDTGQGIQSDFLPYVFDRFRQADTSTTRSYAGLGLGLAIVRHLIEEHGGTVRAESRGPGEGATFTVTLPRFQALAPPAARPQAPGPAVRPSLERVRILVVDDEAEARAALRAALGLLGAKVQVAASAAEALAALDRGLPHVLVSDIGMPGEDGYILIRQVRARTKAAGGEVPAVALTAYATKEDAKQALEAGYQAHLAKPVDVDRLAAVIAELAGRQAALRSERA